MKIFGNLGFLLLLGCLAAGFSHSKTICEKSPEFFRPALCSSAARKLFNKFNELVGGDSDSVSPAISAHLFATFDAQRLEEIESKDLSTLPGSHFTLLSSHEVSKLSADFFGRLRSDQAAVLLDSFNPHLSPESQKLLSRIKNRPSPQARLLIMSLAGLTAAIIYFLGL